MSVWMKIVQLPLVALLSIASIGPLRGQDKASSANPYCVKWRRHFDLYSGLLSVGAAEPGGALWLITHRRPGIENELTRIDTNGELGPSYRPIFLLKPIEWISYLTPAVSGGRVGLLASVTNGGKDQTFEGAFFVQVEADGLGTPVRIAGRGPQFPALVGAGAGMFIAAGDQEPLTLILLDAAGQALWRRSFSHKLVLPEVSVGSSGKIFVVSQGGDYILLQVLDSVGRVLRSKRVSAAQATVAADRDGGCSLLFSPKSNGDEVFLRTYDDQLRPVSQLETSLTGSRGRTYQLITTHRGHLVVGESRERRVYAPNPPSTNVLAEFDRSGALLWQKEISARITPQLICFDAGFFIVDTSHGRGIDVEKYAY